MKRCIVGIYHPKKRSRPATDKGQSSACLPSMTTVLAGRQAPNLSRSGRMMEGYSLAKLKRNGHEVEAGVLALATEFLVVLDGPKAAKTLAGRPRS